VLAASRLLTRRLRPSVVLPTPINTAQNLLRAAAPDHPWLEALLAIPTLSAVTVQLESGRPALATDHTNFSRPCCPAMPSSRIRRFGICPADCLRSFIRPTISSTASSPAPLAGRRYCEVPWPGLGRAVRRCRIISHPHDFYALRPETEALRPHAKRPFEGLVLAGDYMKQPFLASMEGAAISGRRAAETVCVDMS
jgi:15-cis-phytoene desaturase